MGARRERLIALRASVGHTQETLAASMGVDRTTVSRWERGTGLPRPWQMAKLATQLNISHAELADLLSPPAPTIRAAGSATARTELRPDAGAERAQLPTADEPDLGQGAVTSAVGGATMALMDGNVRVGCRTSDGRIIFVSMPRRALLRGATAAAGVTLFSGLATPEIQTVSPVLSTDIHPVESMRSLRRSLVECDNILGPREVVATAEQHVRLIQRLRREASGQDRQSLLQVQAEYAEFCSWLYQDSGDHRAAQYWADRAADWASACGDMELAAYVMARKAQLAGDMRDPIEAIDLAASAQRLARPGSRLSAMGAVYGAHGHAALGDELTAQNTFDQALALLAQPPEAPAGRGRWLDESYVEAQRARSLSLLGRHREAVAAFERAIRTVPANYRRDRGVYLARSAVAQFHAVGPELAAATAAEALSIGAVTGSARIFSELAALDSLLQPWRSVPEVTNFQQALDSMMFHEV
ncbi:helix-turn-helix domain-containing protein [Kitasatospora sp. NPDC052896]|uniref:helix-turn-helix domain-containing protein n=1 Tax=Kitasatospora sp. NPDC052896 TaxID=3364061 RepID=UPI0037C82814